MNDNTVLVIKLSNDGKISVYDSTFEIGDADRQDCGETPLLFQYTVGGRHFNVQVSSAVADAISRHVA